MDLLGDVRVYVHGQNIKYIDSFSGVRIIKIVICTIIPLHNKVLLSLRIVYNYFITFVFQANTYIILLPDRVVHEKLIKISSWEFPATRVFSGEIKRRYKFIGTYLYVFILRKIRIKINLYLQTSSIK